MKRNQKSVINDDDGSDVVIIHEYDEEAEEVLPPVVKKSKSTEVKQRDGLEKECHDVSFKQVIISVHLLAIKLGDSALEAHGVLSNTIYGSASSIKLYETFEHMKMYSLRHHFYLQQISMSIFSGLWSGWLDEKVDPPNEKYVLLQKLGRRIAKDIKALEAELKIFETRLQYMTKAVFKSERHEIQSHYWGINSTVCAVITSLRLLCIDECIDDIKRDIELPYVTYRRTDSLPPLKWGMVTCSPPGECSALTARRCLHSE
jgi:hypothetical protein